MVTNVHASIISALVEFKLMCSNSATGVRVFVGHYIDTKFRDQGVEGLGLRVG